MKLHPDLISRVEYAIEKEQLFIGAADAVPILQAAHGTDVALSPAAEAPHRNQYHTKHVREALDFVRQIKPEKKLAPPPVPPAVDPDDPNHWEDEQIREMLRELDVTFHPNTGRAKLLQYLADAVAPADDDDTDDDD